MIALRAHIESMNAMVESVFPKNRPCPATLKEQLRIFSEYVHIHLIYTLIITLT